MHPIELQAYKLKIENSKGQILNDTLRQIVTLGEFPHELLPAVIDSLQKGEYILAQTLCDILNSTKSKDFYLLVQSKSLLNNWELVQLFKNGFPSPEIEEILCRELYKYFNDNAQPLRSAIVEAMAEHGSDKSDKLLNVIEYELSPTIIDHKYYLETNPEDFLKEAELRSLEEFLKKVKIAKNRIASRTDTSLAEIITVNNDNESNSQNDTTTSIYHRITTYKKRAHDYFNSDPQSSCNQARKAVEAICKELYISSGLESTNKRPADSFKEFDELIKILKNSKVIPSSILIHLDTIQRFGNFGSHDQGQDSIDFTPAMAEPCIKALDIVINWYVASQNNK